MEDPIAQNVVGSLASLAVALCVVVIYLVTKLKKRVSILEMRMKRVEDKPDT